MTPLFNGCPHTKIPGRANCVPALLCILFFLCGNLTAQSSRQRTEPGKVIVKFHPDAVPTVEAGLRTFSRASVDTSTLRVGIRSFDRINRRHRATRMRRVFPDAGVYEAKHRAYGLHLWYEITIPTDEDPKTAAVRYGADGNVQIAEPRYYVRSMTASTPPPVEAPDDPDFGKQWNYYNTGQTGGTPGADIRLLEAWEHARRLGIKNHRVIVAVMDGGVDYDHEDLKANLWVNEAELNGSRNIDDDGNGYRDDTYGYNFVNRFSGALSPEDHATHVAGIIAAVTGNGTGGTGIVGSPDEGGNIRIMSTQILEGDRSVLIGPAYAYAADNGAVISQNSWGYNNPGEYNPSDVDAINYFIEQAGRDENMNPRPGTPMVGGMVIFAAGNEASDARWYPSYFDNVLSVAATNHYGKLAYYSNFGSWVDIAAPGGDMQEKEAGGIYSTTYYADGRKNYEYMQGTSMACPHVSGVAALILSVYGHEGFTPDMLRARLLNNATSLADFDPANASKMGAGLLNAAAVLVPGVAPEAVSDLTARATSHVSGKLAWTIPPVSNNSTVVSAEVACSTEAITATNFDKNTVTTTRTSEASGTELTYTLTGLAPETVYHVAVRSMGNTGDKSAISNTATFTTLINHAPTVSGLPADTTFIPHNATTIVLSKYFTDADGDQLNYTYMLSQRGIVGASVRENTLTLDPQLHGSVALQITASDPFGATRTATVNITVEQKYAPDKADELLVYPNPTSDILRYSYILNKSASVTVRIVNLAGQTVIRTPTLKQQAGTHYHTISLADLNTGIYIIQYIKDGKSVVSKKVVKQ